MSIYQKIVCTGGRKKPAKSYSWQSILHEFEAGKGAFVAVNAFNNALRVSFDDVAREGILFETIVHDYDHVCDGVKCKWFARVLKVCGFYVLSEFVGSSTRFWIHLLSDEICPLGDSMNPIDLKTNIYAPPPNVMSLYHDDLDSFMKKTIDDEMIGELGLSPGYDENKEELVKSRFRVGQRLELLNYATSTEIRVARVQEVCGRRMNVLVTKKDYPGSLPNSEEDRQVQGSGTQFWIDEESFFVFPVGFAAYNNYKLVATEEYIQHTAKITLALMNGQEPEYHIDDIRFTDLSREDVDKEKWENMKVGLKFELIDPLAQEFRKLNVASVISLCNSNGYIIVGIDGPDMNDESFPLHIDNVFMFPVGYCEQNNLKLKKPDGYKKSFKWDEYLAAENAQPLQIELFRPTPPQERLDKFQVGMRLEAADMCENQLISPGRISSIHGRIINVNFDGWEETFDELYDINSHDIFPIGWCELHNYVLQHPGRNN
ncbi:hypothetical protein L3Y34_015159 [Caenorhabditis briggsae]|uniref:Protein CBR-LIN-61 n=1 Tax=Caenorhabditis briggsae TaxID=6238 RepID=A0AAE9IZB7_CAEBR|nr:hypothetical protein L3Y34_015159 [Caenorhabditis briggsae]